MKAEGVEFVTGVNVGVDKKAAELLKEYDRVILACGASNPRDIKVPGREAKRHLLCGGFSDSYHKEPARIPLSETNSSSRPKERTVLVIGGGDTGNDCVGTSIRLGAASVIQLEMMPKLPSKRTEQNPWPEWPRVLKTDYGQEEAIAVFGKDPRVYQTTVKEFVLDKGGNVTKAKLVKLEPKKDEKTGRTVMEEVPGSENIIDVDLVLIAAGFLGSQDYVTRAFGVKTDARTNVATEGDSYRTSQPAVFAAGDVRRGQSLVVWAIAEGRNVARAVDESLMGYTNL